VYKRQALEAAGVLAPGATTVAYSYIGPQVTYPFYRSGTIGKAKEHLERTTTSLAARLKKAVGGTAYVSVNKALVTKASAVIPAVSLYVSLLYKVMKKHGTHEGCIEQIARLFRERLYTGGSVPVDATGLIRIDDWEMEAKVQKEVADLWAIERTAGFKGVYHVIGGTLSALDGRGPQDLNFASLVQRCAGNQVREVVLALNATVEGQTTSHYIADRLKESPVQVTRLAHGVPVGGELDYLDDGTLVAALKARRAV